MRLFIVLFLLSPFLSISQDQPFIGNEKKESKNPLEEYDLNAKPMHLANLKKYELVFIKIDLEGHDIKAIYGSLNIIRKIKTVVMFEFSKMIYTSNFVEKNFINFLTKNNLIITNLNLELLTLRDLKNRLAKLDSSHQTCGNYLLFKKTN